LRIRPLLLVDAATTVATVSIALLRSLPLFRPLPIQALEGVAATATELSVPPGQVILREGEVGDRYYAIADGEVQVTRQGEFVARLERGEGFGEIALLEGGIRTATVSTLTGARFLVVDRDPFLVAVTGHGPTHARAAEIATNRLPSAAPAGG
jgi:CRP-like cAMP-binding protein